METNEVYHWLIQSQRRREMLKGFNQPLTAKQLARRLGITIDSCSFLFWQLTVYAVVCCLNAKAKTNRLHWLTATGVACQRRLRAAERLPPLDRFFPSVDWNLYGSICFSHRSAVIKALMEPLQPADIKRKAKLQNVNLRMSANNVRDVIRLLLDYGIVRPVWTRKRAHPRYELKEQAKVFRELLLSAERMP